MILYHYWRSSTSYRVRIALNLKKLEYKTIHINLLKNEENSEDYKKINPQGLVPSLVHNGNNLTQSLAIMEYLETLFPENSFLTKDPVLNLKIRAFSYAIACEIHPINNLRVLNYLTSELNISKEKIPHWHQHWIEETFNVLEKLAEKTYGKFVFGDKISMADICLVPQIYNAYRYNIDMKKYPILSLIDKNCMQNEFFIKAKPENQVV